MNSKFLFKILVRPSFTASWMSIRRRDIETKSNLHSLLFAPQPSSLFPSIVLSSLVKNASICASLVHVLPAKLEAAPDPPQHHYGRNCSPGNDGLKYKRVVHIPGRIGVAA